MHKEFRFRIRKTSATKGIAVVELAVCLPVLTLITLATIESSAMILLQQSLSVAAYEGARVSLTPGATKKIAKKQSKQIMKDRDIQDGKVKIRPNNLANTAPGDWITVETTASFGENSLAGGWLFNQKILSAKVAMMKER